MGSGNSPGAGHNLQHCGHLISTGSDALTAPSSVCFRRVVNVLEGFASVFYISNKSRLLAFAATTRRRILVENDGGESECRAADAVRIMLS